MVKSIAEQEGIRMPSFFGYLLYSGAVLVPLYLAVTWIYL
jgi:Na+/H+ antiporter NhaD/arsenite permease-like protein